MFSNKSRVYAFALYDWGNSAFTTLVVTFIYSAYFVKSIVPAGIDGSVIWARGISVCAILVALISPVLGVMADQRDNRRFFLIVSTGICIILTAALAFVIPGYIMTALVIFILANIAFEVGGVFYNSFLPDIAPTEGIGRISGFAWAMGYAGGLACLVLALVGFVNSGEHWFGISNAEGFNVRATNLLVAAWFLIFSLPFLISIRDKRRRGSVSDGIIRSSFGKLAESFSQLKRYRQLWRFLLARLIYNDGLVTFFAMAGIYAQETFSFAMSEVVIFAIVLNVAAGAGAFLFGYFDDRAGARTTILVSLAVLSPASVLAVMAPSRFWFWAAALVIAFFIGPNQSASRSLMGRFTPEEKEGEFFGFFAFSGKFSSFLAPLLFSIVKDITGSMRWGISTVLLFFIVGGWIFLGVDEAEGQRAAKQY